ncbi:MAG: hypothetical protein ACJAX4_000916 [Clostridium sp.]|jgi:hypothetical protein
MHVNIRITFLRLVLVLENSKLDISNIISEGPLIVLLRFHSKECFWGIID